ncbi:uncharacterized protein LOC125653954 isoform X2 [Ostrea edulis]|uniref:uncharacterized protein LOC125653954 isoform X2 n=1 Tax=Ostrea edulis TaxID=37623 RepID=UPI0024AEC6F0|nr:uncharacterized protein LOC125653954 isoform X2 [Ostrea edulis]
MIIFQHLLILELYLYAGISIKPLLTSKIDGDYTVYDEVKSFDSTLRILGEIREKQCLPCFIYTKNWREDTFLNPSSTSDDLQLCRQIKCSFQGRCLRFKKDICYSWTFTVISDKKEYVLFSRTNPSSDEKTNLNITCYGTGTAQISTTVRKHFWSETSNPDKKMPNQDVGVDDNNDNDGEDKEATKTENKKNPNPACQKKCKQCRKCSGNKTLNDCVNAAKQKDCPGCSNLGILLITHVIAAGIGGGILYLIQFIKEFRRKRTDEAKPESNDEMINASYGHTRGTDILQMSNVSHQEEGIYSEVADKPDSLLNDNTIPNCSTGSVLNDRKHSTLPDIPHDSERDEEYLLPQIPKSLSLPDTHVHLSEEVNKSTSIVQEELPLKDVNDVYQRTEFYEILQDASATDGGNNVYSFLQKADELDLK